MEITWTYNFLETIAFIVLVILGIYALVKLLAYLALWIFWGGGR